MEKVLILIISLILLMPPLSAQDTAGLAALEKQAKAKEAQLKKIKQQEQKLSQEIQTLSKKEKNAQQLAQRLLGDIRYIETKQQMAVQHKTILEESLPLWQGIISKEATTLAVHNALQSSYFGSAGALEQQVIMSALLAQHGAFLAKLTEEAQKTGSKIDAFEQQNHQLAEQKDKAEQQKEQIQSNYQKKQHDLGKTQEQYKKAQEDLKELKESARQMQQILKEAEEKRKKASTKAGQAATKANINIEKNSLPWPVSGRIISSFGKEYQPKLKTWIFRDGLKISAREGEPVVASAAGNVIFAGEFRSYGNVVIVDHDKGFFTIYGFLDTIRAGRGTPVHAGQIIGTAGRDTQGAAMGSGAPAVYFEIRSGTTAVDPEIWLKQR